MAFIWILRKPQGVDSSDLLPPGFANRTLSQGVVVLGWAPQQEILAHPAIGGCLFHSGWGTAVESLVHGHPLVLLPMVSDQGLTAKLLVEKQVGYEVPRGEDGSFSRDMVIESIRRVFVEEEGEQLRLKAEVHTCFPLHQERFHSVAVKNKYTWMLILSAEEVMQTSIYFQLYLYYNTGYQNIYQHKEN